MSTQTLNLSPDLLLGGRPVVLTTQEVRRIYGPAYTLGADDETRLAMDAQLESDGVYTLLQHSLETGIGMAPQFLGYAALQNISQNGLIRACIETVTDDMTRSWIELKGKTGDGNTEELARLDEAIAKFNLQKCFHEACELVGYEGGAFIFIDTGASGEQLQQPLHLGAYSAEVQPDSPLRFTVIDPVNVFPGEYNSLSPLRPDYFKPRWWWVLGERVHASRLVRLVANEVPLLLRPSYNFLGLAQAQILWDYVLHFQECRIAEARLLKKFSMTVFKTNMNEVLTQADVATQLDRRIQYMVQNMSNDGVLAVDYNNEDVVKLETPLSGVTDIVRQALELLAALNRTPAVKLLGISPSGFNATGESDIRNYYDHIASQQEKVIRPALVRILDCIQLHELGRIDKGIDFTFTPLSKEDQTAIATRQKTKADTLAVYLDRSLISAEEARAALVADTESGFANLDPDELPDEPDVMGAAPEMVDISQDWGFDGDNVWRTAENGKKFEIDKETGEITKGNVGQKPRNRGYEARPLESITPDVEHFHELISKNDGNYEKGAREYFREKLQGRYVETKDAEGKPIQVAFTGGTWQEIKRNMNVNTEKAEIVPFMAEIVVSGEVRSTGVHKDRNDNALHFYEYSKRVQTSKGERLAIVDVIKRAKSEPEYSAFSITHEGEERYPTRISHDTKKGCILMPSGSSLITQDASNENTIMTSYEVVNIRFAER